MTIHTVEAVENSLEELKECGVIKEYITEHIHEEWKEKTDYKFHITASGELVSLNKTNKLW